MALVILPTIGTDTPKDFAVALFKAWKIGRKGKDDGLLILVVSDRRRLEIETGYGLEGALPDITLARIQREHMVPAMKRGDLALGLQNGIARIGAVLGSAAAPGAQQVYSPSATNDVFGPPAANAFPARLVVPDYGLRRPATGLLIGLVILGLLAALAVLFKSDPRARYGRLNHRFGFLPLWTVAAILFPVVWVITVGFTDYLTLAAGLLGGPAWYALGRFVRDAWSDQLRLSPRRCAECAAPMVRQSVAKERAFETPNQIVEEQIGSVDYDVWLCPRGHRRLDAYDGEFADQFTPCPKCGAWARVLKSDQTIREPTYASAGQGERSYTCRACHQTTKEHYDISQLSDGGDGGFGGFGGGDGGGSSDFGGGSSGGGGSGSDF